jgi:hypothetical protein
MYSINRFNAELREAYLVGHFTATISDGDQWLNINDNFVTASPAPPDTMGSKQ